MATIVMIDLDGILKDKSLGSLSWEIIEARGVACGDTHALWSMVIACGQSAHDMIEEGNALIDAFEDTDIPDSVNVMAKAMFLLAEFLRRDAREIVKFLHSRGFEFPSEHVGKRP